MSTKSSPIPYLPPIDFNEMEGVEVTEKRRRPKINATQRINRRRLRGDDAAEAVRLHDEEGWSQKRLATHFGVSRMSVRTVLQYAGQLEPKTPPNPDELRDIPGMEGVYAVTKDGRVWSYPRPSTRGGWRKTFVNQNGYPFVMIVMRGETVPKSVHRLVAQTWIPNPEGKREVNHINSNRADPRVENLEWVTRSENMRHAVANGRTQPLTADWKARMQAGRKKFVTPEMLAKAIHLRATTNLLQREVAEILGVSRDVIGYHLRKSAKQDGRNRA